MSKITATKLYEYNPDDKLPEKFVTHYNTALEQIISCLSGNVTFEDNIKGTKLVVNLTHEKQQILNADASGVIGILPIKITTDSNKNEAFTSFSWFSNSSGKLVVVPGFKNANATEAQECTLFIAKQ